MSHYPVDKTEPREADVVSIFDFEPRCHRITIRHDELADVIPITISRIDLPSDVTER
jgi:hypothetical protein